MSECKKRCFDSEDGERVACVLESGHEGPHAARERYLGSDKDLAWLLDISPVVASSLDAKSAPPLGDGER